MIIIQKLLGTAFNPSWACQDGKRASLTVRYVYISLLRLSAGGEKTVQLGLGKVASELSVSRPTLHKALKELVALGMVMEPYSTPSKEKFFDVVAPKVCPTEQDDSGQEQLVSEVLWGRLRIELCYQQRMVLALLICLSSWRGVVRGEGKESLARRLGLAGRQIRNHLRALLEGQYLVTYRGGLAGEVRRPGSIALNPEKLFEFGWWDRVDLITAKQLATGPGWWNQQRISPYLRELMGQAKPMERLKGGQLVTSEGLEAPATKACRDRPKPMELSNYLLDGVFFPAGMTERLLSTISSGQAGRKHTWTDMARNSEGLGWLIDEAFFDLVCGEVMKWQGDLSTGELRKLSLQAVGSIDSGLMPLLTTKNEEGVAWGQRRWLLQGLRLAVARMALWSWCCLSAVYSWDVDETGLSFELHRVIAGPIPKGGVVPSVKWLVRLNQERGESPKCRKFEVPEDWELQQL